MPPLTWTQPPALGPRSAARRLVRRAGRALMRTPLRAQLIRSQEHSLYGPRRDELRLSPDRVPRLDTVHLEVRTRCNGRCSFCAAAVGHDPRPDRAMSWSLYRDIVAQLRARGFEGRLTYFVNNDPLLHPEIVGFVQHARQALPGAYIQLLTNGLALTEARALSLLEAGIDELSINWYSRATQPRVPAHLRRIWQQVLPRVHPPSRIRPGCSLDPRQDADLRFNLWWRRQDEVLTNRAGSAPNRSTPALPPPRGFCEMPFRVLCVTTDGRVARCPSDFGFRHPVGDLRANNIDEIWAGETYSKLRRSLLRGRRDEDALCAGCDFYGVCFLQSVTLRQRLVRALTE